MGGLEELLSEHKIGWDPKVIDRGRVEILRRFRRYQAEWPVPTALRLAYMEVEMGAPDDFPTTGFSCPSAGSGCSGCRGAES